MKAVVDGQVVAQSNDVIDCKGYQYFPPGAVRMDWLQKTAKTADDLKCPHGVQFYDVVVEGKRHARAADAGRTSDCAAAAYFSNGTRSSGLAPSLTHRSKTKLYTEREVSRSLCTASWAVRMPSLVTQR